MSHGVFGFRNTTEASFVSAYLQQSISLYQIVIAATL